MVTNSREYFLRKLEPVKNRLPKNYGVFYRRDFPKENIRHVYDVVQKKVIDWDVLENLKKVIKKYGVNQADNQ